MERGISVSPAVLPHVAETALSLKLLKLELGVKTPAVRWGKSRLCLVLIFQAFWSFLVFLFAKHLLLVLGTTACSA